MHVCMLSCFSCVWLCDSMDCSPLGSSVHGIFQARILEWVAMPFSNGSFLPRDWTHISWISCITGGFFAARPPGKPPISPTCSQKRRKHFRLEKFKVQTYSESLETAEEKIPGECNSLAKGEGGHVQINCGHRTVQEIPCIWRFQDKAVVTLGSHTCLIQQTFAKRGVT